MPRELTDLEIDGFLERHPQVWTDVGIINGGGYTAAPLAYPKAGMAIQEPSGRYVLVWRDASQRWHFIDLSDMSLMNTIADQLNQPPYVSDPDYLGGILDALQLTVSVGSEGLMAAVVVIGVLLFLRR